VRKQAVAASVVTVFLLTLTPALASTSMKPVCMLVSDPAGDAKIGGVGPTDDGLDILSGDLASGRSAVVVALRLKSGQADANAPLGRTFVFKWVVMDTKRSMVTQKAEFREYANAAPAADFFPNASDQLSAVSVPASLDPSTGAITWRIPRSTARVLRGARFTSLEATSLWSANVATSGGSDSTSTQADGGVGHASYVDGTPSCLKGA
jgi:hypothetical protein